MYLGIDVGGTHTDAAAVDHGEVVASSKVITDHENLLVSINAVLEDLAASLPHDRIDRLNLSTTLSTNAIVEGKTEETGVLVSSGPGVDPENYRIGRCFHNVGGSVDHRGYEIEAPDPKKIEEAVACSRELGISAFAVVSKFSVRNPAHEDALRTALDSMADHVSLGHRMSGLLNFPRRIATAYYNAAVWRVYNKFAAAVEQSVREHGIAAPINVLKADGGTMPFALSRELPVESIRSGPAAGVMGIMALCDINEDCLILDIGGTTTDIAVFTEGEPIVERDGIELGSYPTLIKSLKTHSIGVGGDSILRVTDGRVFVGPEREGPCMAQGGKHPTLIDAMNYLRIASFGDRDASARGIEKLAKLWDKYPEKTAQEAVDRALQQIKDECDHLVWELNHQPVYTIHELLEGKKIEPKKIYCMGAPAKAFEPLLKKAFEREVEVPGHYGAANAVGAALTGPTFELELFADTDKGRLFVPTLDVERKISKAYSQADAEKDALEYLKNYMNDLGLSERREMEISESESFNMVDFFGGSGKNIRVKCRVKPGISR